MNSPTPSKFATTGEFFFRLSWYERLRALFGRPVRVKVEIGFIKAEKKLTRHVEIHFASIGGTFADG